MKRVINGALRRLGYQISRVPPLHALRVEREQTPVISFLSTLKRFGFAPRHIVDIGANHGHWTRQAIEVFPNALYTLVEPQDWLKTNVQDLVLKGHKISWINAGAGDKSGVAHFSIFPRDDSSTFSLSPDEGEKLGAKQVALPIKTLNEIVAASGSTMPEIVKIDAEGLDLKVLDGASDLIGKTEIFFIEAAVCAGRIENTMSEVVKKMTALSYRVMDITDLNRSPRDNVLWLCELAFVRCASPVLQQIKSYE